MDKDGDTVKTGKEAVERYALPNPEPASYRFTIKPQKDTPLTKGVVAWCGQAGRSRGIEE